jgi:uncharacterized protein YbaR (Trm112 family)
VSEKPESEIDPNLLEILRCPKDRLPLRMADAALLERVNRAIEAGAVRNQVGRTVEKPLDGGLVREDGALLYPIYDGIPVMLVDEAIDPRQLGEAG